MNATRKAEITYLYLAIAIFEGRTLSIQDLHINGHDLMEMGYRPGPLFGQCFNHLLQCVVDGKFQNDPCLLRRNAELFMQEHNAPLL